MLLDLMGGLSVAEFSSSLSPSKRAAIVAGFKAGSIEILVCSDAMARGMDVTEVANVISYDAPVHVQTYVHRFDAVCPTITNSARVGRTARAGQEGSAFTILRPNEVRHFKELRRKIDSKFVNTIKLTEEDRDPFFDQYEVGDTARISDAYKPPRTCCSDSKLQ